MVYLLVFLIPLSPGAGLPEESGLRRRVGISQRLRHRAEVNAGSEVPPVTDSSQRATLESGRCVAATGWSDAAAEENSFVGSAWCSRVDRLEGTRLS